MGKAGYDTNNRQGILAHRNLPTVLFFVSIGIFLFYLVTAYLVRDVYAYAWTGALFELLSFPILILLFAIPPIILIRVFRFKSGRVYGLISLLMLGAVLSMIFLTD